MTSVGLGPRRATAWYVDALAEAHALLRAADEGDRQAVTDVRHAGRALGEAAAAVIAVVDPEMVVLGGPIGVHPLLLGQVQATVDDLSAAPTKIVASALGEMAPLQGALHVAREHARTRLLTTQ